MEKVQYQKIEEINQRYLELYERVSAQRARAEAEFQYFKIGQIQIQQQMIILKDLLEKAAQNNIPQQRHQQQRELLRRFKELQEKYQPTSLVYPWRRNQIIQLNLQLKRRPAVPKQIEILVNELQENRVTLRQKIEETEQKIKEAQSKTSKLHEQRNTIHAQLQHLQDTSMLQTAEAMFIYNKNSIKMSRITQDIQFIEKKIKDMVEYSDKLKNQVLLKITKTINNYVNIADMEYSRGTTFQQKPLSLISRTMTG